MNNDPSPIAMDGFVLGNFLVLWKPNLFPRTISFFIIDKAENGPLETRLVEALAIIIN